MCRLLGYVAPSSTTLEELIGDRQCDLFRSMGRLHADGWGSAWLDDSTQTVRRFRDTIPAQRADSIANVLSVDPARARLVHLRMATAGIPVTRGNSHPFLVGGLAFAHNGSVPRERVHELIEPDYLANVAGDTDSELYFALIRQRHGQGLSLFDATCSAVQTLRGLFPNASLNALLLSPDELIVVHSSEGAKIPRREFQASGLTEAELPLDHLSAYYRMSYRRTPDGATTFSSTGIDTTEWTPLPPATVASVNVHTCELTTRSLLATSVASTV